MSEKVHSSLPMLSLQEMELSIKFEEMSLHANSCVHARSYPTPSLFFDIQFTKFSLGVLDNFLRIPGRVRYGTLSAIDCDQFRYFYSIFNMPPLSIG